MPLRLDRGRKGKVVFMYKVIKGARYNTETAKCLASWSTPCAVSDFKYYEETLYRTKAGNYFLHGEGHGASPYRKREPDGWTHGEKIIPMTYEQAQAWAEEHLNGDEYESIFGDNDVGADATLTVSAGAMRKLQQIQSQSGKTLKAVIDELLGVQS